MKKFVTTAMLVFLLCACFITGCQSHVKIPKGAIYIGGGKLDYTAPDDGILIVKTRGLDGKELIESTHSLSKGENFEYGDSGNATLLLSYYFVPNVNTVK